MAKWFVQTSLHVEGPYTTEMVKSRLDSGYFDKSDLVWGRVQDEWKPLSWWQNSLSQLEEAYGDSEAATQWYYGFGGQSFGPLSRNDLVEKVRQIGARAKENLSKVLIWTQGMKSWVGLFEFPDLLEEIGVTRREHPRVPIEGKAIIKTVGTVYLSQLSTISEGGCGVQATPGLYAGEIVTVELQSSQVRDSIHAKAEVRYCTETIVGFKFTQVSVENRSLILQYIKQADRQFVLKKSA